MMTEQDFARLVDLIKARGYDEETAIRYAEIIGDTPEVDGQGHTLVRNLRGEIIDRLTLGE